MVQKDIDALLAEHPFFKDFPPAYRALIAGCGKNVYFESGKMIAKSGDPAEQFFAIREGRVSIEIHAPWRGPLIVQSVEAGDVIGWSWLFPPHRWKFDVRAMEPVHAVSFDGVCLRGKCERDPAMGFEFMKRFSHVFMLRLEAARLQLLDLYGSASP
jgi:CRP/FNR family transcriptional regulator, cyclic AMP receptor protein